MAYLDVREQLSFATALPMTPSADSMPVEPVGFAQHEWDVIQIARRDGLASLSEPTRLARLSAWLFGGGISLRLADPRLEALRRLSVLAWHHGYVVPVSSIKAFTDAGYTGDQLEFLLASIASSRSSRSSRTGRIFA
ncbi:MAG TPA: hypothetical protein VKQ09_06160 [Sphingomonas sp.]|nr:hypothetical protein [Sphingomonas sp.]